MKQIFFLCTGNSCRSQFAEGLANFYGRGNTEEERLEIFRKTRDKIKELVINFLSQLQE
ncbi:MAG: hypothetical protein AB1633_10265 [Elusimicrobiota bacterium]